MPSLVLLVLSLFLAASCGGSSTPPAKPEPPKPVAQPAAATFNAVGDMMISRGVARSIERAGDPLHPFSGLKSVFNSVDFNFGNLETPVSGNDSRIGKGLVFNAKVAHIAGLTEYKFKIVNLANNHALDQGLKGLVNTWKVLDERGIKHIGTGPDLDAAWRPQYVEANGIKFGFIGASYASINDGGVARNNNVARIEDYDRLERSIKQARSESEFVVVTMHAGIEYVRKPHQPQIDFARRAIDSGADIVIGAHPHWIQTVETYKGKMIFYSLGNFIFDQRKPDTMEGLLLKIAVRRTVDGQTATTAVERIDLVPVIIEDFAVPRPVSDAQSKAILKKIGFTENFIIPGK